MGTDPLIGLRVGDYVVQARAGAGGIGLVYRAEHTALKRPVALKVLKPEHAADPDQRARFLREAQAMAAIRHKGIVTVETVGVLPDGRDFIVMELLEGETLEALFRREGKMPLAGAAALVDELLDALSAAHDVGVVHRDLKPSNVFVVKQAGGSGYVKLLDFGLAKAGAPSATPGGARARASVVAGTPQYMSPEQAEGLAATPRSDLYALGGMLFELVTGRLPFEGQGWAELFAAQLHRPAPRLATLLPDAPKALDELVASLLEKDPELRPASAAAVRAQLKAALRGVETDPRRPAAAVRRVDERTEPMARPLEGARAPERPTEAARLTAVRRVLGVERRTAALALGSLAVLGGISAGVAWALVRRAERPVEKPAVVLREAPAVVARPAPPPPPAPPAAPAEPFDEEEFRRKLRELDERESRPAVNSAARAANACLPERKRVARARLQRTYTAWLGGLDRLDPEYHARVRRLAHDYDSIRALLDGSVVGQDCLEAERVVERWAYEATR